MDYNFIARCISRDFYLAIAVISCFSAYLKTLQGFHLNRRSSKPIIVHVQPVSWYEFFKNPERV